MSSLIPQIRCVLLDGSNYNYILDKFLFTIQSFKTASFLSNEIIKELNKKYPGVNMISLYFSNFLYKKAFGTDLSEKYIEINDELDLTDNQIVLLQKYPIYFKITNLYGIKKFSKIEEIECTFKTLDNKSSFVNLLLPDVSLPVDRFKQILMDYMKHMK